jgi:hypothetical protein
LGYNSQIYSSKKSEKRLNSIVGNLLFFSISSLSWIGHKQPYRMQLLSSKRIKAFENIPYSSITPFLKLYKAIVHSYLFQLLDYLNH